MNGGGAGWKQHNVIAFSAGIRPFVLQWLLMLNFTANSSRLRILNSTSQDPHRLFWWARSSHHE